MTNSKNGKKSQRKSSASKDVLTGLGKELALIGLLGVKEMTGIDLHHKPKNKHGKPPWAKKWGEK